MKSRELQVAVECLHGTATVAFKTGLSPAEHLKKLKLCRPAGVFAEDIFRGLDYAIAQAGRFGLKVVVPLSNYWDFHDSLGDVSSHACGLHDC